MSRSIASTVYRRLATSSQTIASSSRGPLSSTLSSYRLLHATARHSEESQARRAFKGIYNHTSNPEDSHHSARSASAVEEEGSADLYEEDAESQRKNWVSMRRRREATSAVIVRDFPEHVTIHDIRHALEPYGELLQLNFHGRSVCYARYKQLRSAQTLIYNTKKIPLRVQGEQVKVNYAVSWVEVGEPTPRLWVSGLDISTRPDLAELKELFEQYGEVENIILNRKGLPTCIVRYTDVESATEAIEQHRLRPLRHRGLVLQLRYGHADSLAKREPNETLHVMGFCGDEATLLSYIPEHASKVQHLFMSHPQGPEMERRDVFIKFDSVDTAEEAMAYLNVQLGIAAQFAWPRKSQ